MLGVSSLTSDLPALEAARDTGSWSLLAAPGMRAGSSQLVWDVQEGPGDLESESKSPV